MTNLLWYARDAKVWIGDALTGISPSTTLKTQMASATDFTGKCKEVKISGAERDLEAINVLGIGQLDQQGRPTIVECTLTLIYDDATKSGQFLAGSIKAVTGTTFNRVTFGEHDASYGDRVRKAVLIELDDGTNKVYALLNNSFATTREWSLAADGHVEETLTFKGLAQNYMEEDNIA